MQRYLLSLGTDYLRKLEPEAIKSHLEEQLLPKKIEYWLEILESLRPVFQSIPGQLILGFQLRSATDFIPAIFLVRDAVFILKLYRQEEDLKSVIHNLRIQIQTLRSKHKPSSELQIFGVVYTFNPLVEEEIQSFNDILFSTYERLPAMLKKQIAKRPGNARISLKKWLEGEINDPETSLELIQSIYLDGSLPAKKTHHFPKSWNSLQKKIREISQKANEKKIIVVLGGVPNSGKSVFIWNLIDLHPLILSEKNYAETYLSLFNAYLERAEQNGDKLTPATARRHLDARYQSPEIFNKKTKKSSDILSNPIWLVDDIVDQDKVLEAFDKKKTGLLVLCVDLGISPETNIQMQALRQNWKKRFPDTELYFPRILYPKAKKEEEKNITTADFTKTEFFLFQSLRQQELQNFIQHLFSNQPIELSESDFSIALTRNLSLARLWIQQMCDYGDRSGIIQSSSAGRLRAEGILPARYEEINNWFSAPTSSLNSSNALEVSITEQHTPELDYALLAWDLDLKVDEENHWIAQRFDTENWYKIEDTYQHIIQYQKLLSCSRKGLIIFIPAGSPIDSTRRPEDYDSIANYLMNLGIDCLD